jgi:hypothetical protein
VSEHPHSEHKPPYNTPSSFGVVYPENDIVAVIGDRAAAERAVEALRAAGIPTDDVDLASGEQVLDFERQRRQNEQHPRLARIGRAVASALSDDVEYHEQLLAAARAGGQFVVVHAPAADVVDKVRPILREHRPRLALYYRKGSIEQLA